MAKQLDEFPEGMASGRPDKYSWKEWFNGRPWELEMGTDFTTSQQSFRQTAKSAAKTRGGTVRIGKLDDKRLVLQFIKSDADS